MDAVIAPCGEGAQHRAHEDAAGAETERVDVLGSGYLLDHLDGAHDPARVGVDVPVRLRRRGVPPAEHEHAQAAAGRVLDEAAPRPEVEEVVPADRWRYDQQRALADGRRAR